jgi:ribonuclease P protein component
MLSSAAFPVPGAPVRVPAAARRWSRMSREHPESLGRPHRLRLSLDHARVKAAATPLRGRFCLLLALPVPGEPTKIGFIASKKGVGNAVARNLARRRLREIARRRFPRVPKTGFWLTFIAFRGALTAPHTELATDVERLLAQAGALAPIEPGRS